LVFFFFQWCFIHPYFLIFHRRYLHSYLSIYLVLNITASIILKRVLFFFVLVASFPSFFCVYFYYFYFFIFFFLCGCLSFFLFSYADNHSLHFYCCCVEPSKL
jgi:hypothetical protein